MLLQPHLFEMVHHSHWLLPDMRLRVSNMSLYVRKANVFKYLVFEELLCPHVEFPVRGINIRLTGLLNVEGPIPPA